MLFQYLPRSVWNNNDEKKIWTEFNVSKRNKDMQIKGNVNLCINASDLRILATQQSNATCRVYIPL